MAHEKTLKCPQCGNEDPKQITVLERGVVNENAILCEREDGKIEVGTQTTYYDNSEYFLCCQVCHHEQPVRFENLVYT